MAWPVYPVNFAAIRPRLPFLRSPNWRACHPRVPCCWIDFIRLSSRRIRHLGIPGAFFVCWGRHGEDLWRQRQALVRNDRAWLRQQDNERRVIVIPLPTAAFRLSSSSSVYPYSLVNFFVRRRPERPCASGPFLPRVQVIRGTRNMAIPDSG